MPSPRQIAEEKNNSGSFDRSVETNYDPEAGTPKGIAPQGPLPDYAANPVNPPEAAAPAKNLKR